jgi:hypothetical protein
MRSGLRSVAAAEAAVFVARTEEQDHRVLLLTINDK